MGADSEEEDFVFFGTPIEREEGPSSRKKKAVVGYSGQLRSLPSCKQEPCRRIPVVQGFTHNSRIVSSKDSDEQGYEKSLEAAICAARSKA